MSSIKTKDTGPELKVRKLLSLLGYRYRLHKKDLPGTPDIVFPIRRKAVFVHGCFWHGHNCSKGGLPKSKLGYWQPKIGKNKKRDAANLSKLKRSGWLALVIWQCQLRKMEILEKRLKEFLGNSKKTKKISRVNS